MATLMVMRCLRNGRGAARRERVGMERAAFEVASKDRLHRGDHVLDGEPEMFEQDRSRRRLAEAIDAHDRRTAIVDGADVLAPTDL